MVFSGTYPPSHKQCNWIPFYVVEELIISCARWISSTSHVALNVFRLSYWFISLEIRISQSGFWTFHLKFMFSIKIDFYYCTLATLPRFLWSYHWLVSSILCSSLKRNKSELWSRSLLIFWNVLWLLSLLLLNWASLPLSVIILHFNSLQ